MEREMHPSNNNWAHAMWEVQQPYKYARALRVGLLAAGLAACGIQPNPVPEVAPVVIINPGETRIPPESPEWKLADAESTDILPVTTDTPSVMIRDYFSEPFRSYEGDWQARWASAEKYTGPGGFAYEDPHYTTPFGSIFHLGKPTLYKNGQEIGETQGVLAALPVGRDGLHVELVRDLDVDPGQPLFMKWLVREYIPGDESSVDKVETRRITDHRYKDISEELLRMCATAQEVWYINYLLPSADKKEVLESGDIKTRINFSGPFGDLQYVSYILPDTDWENSYILSPATGHMYYTNMIDKSWIKAVPDWVRYDDIPKLIRDFPDIPEEMLAQFDDILLHKFLGYLVEKDSYVHPYKPPSAKVVDTEYGSIIDDELMIHVVPQYPTEERAWFSYSRITGKLYRYYQPLTPGTFEYFGEWQELSPGEISSLSEYEIEALKEAFR